MSVTGFAKLLVDQISAKVSFTQAKQDIEQSSTKIAAIKGHDLNSYFENLSSGLLKFLDKSSLNGETERENSAIIAAYLSNAGVPFESNVDINSGIYVVEWDIVVTYPPNEKIGFDIKSSRGRRSPQITEERVSNLSEWLQDGGLHHGILIEGAARGQAYVRNVFETPAGIKVHRIGPQILA